MPFGGFDTESMVGKGATSEHIINKVSSKKSGNMQTSTAIMPVMARDGKSEFLIVLDS